MCWAGPAFHQEADSREGTRGEGARRSGHSQSSHQAQEFPTTLFCFSVCENVLAHLRGINQMKPEPLQAVGRKKWRAPSSSLPPEKREPLPPPYRCDPATWQRLPETRRTQMEKSVLRPASWEPRSKVLQPRRAASAACQNWTQDLTVCSLPAPLPPLRIIPAGGEDL